MTTYAAMILNAGIRKREQSPRLLVLILEIAPSGASRVLAVGKAADHTDSRGVYPILEGPSATGDLYIKVQDYEDIIRDPQNAHLFSSEGLRDNPVWWLEPGEMFVKAS